jgi:TRAP-type C4-dicarboxylate transport system substrate-binding protein
MKKIVTLIFVIAVTFFLSFYCINPGFAKQLPAVKWDLPHFCAPTYFIAKDLQQFAKDVEAKTNGKFNIILHAGSSLLKGPQVAPALVAGRVPIGPVLSPYVYDLFPRVTVLYMPFLTSSLQEHRSAGEKLRGYFYDVLKEKNLKPLFMYAWPTQQLFSLKPMDTVEALKGKKVRIFNAQQADLCKRVKAVPTNIAFSELYTALQRGTVDAYITSNTNIPVMKFYEVSKYANQWTINGGGMEFLCVNLGAWKKLPKEYQDALLEVVEETKIEDKLWADAAKTDEDSINEMKSKGMSILYPAKAEIEEMQKIARPVWDAWAEKQGTEELLKNALEAVGR